MLKLSHDHDHQPNILFKNKQTHGPVVQKFLNLLPLERKEPFLKVLTEFKRAHKIKQLKERPALSVAWALRHNYPELVKGIVSPVEAKLYIAAKNGNLEVLEQALKENPKNINLALQVAVEHEKVAIVRQLLKHRNVDPSIKHNQALRLAIELSNFDLVDLLSKHPKVKNMLGMSLMMTAINKKEYPIFQLLVSRTDPTFENNQFVRQMFQENAFLPFDYLMRHPKIRSDQNLIKEFHEFAPFLEGNRALIQKILSQKTKDRLPIGNVSFLRLAHDLMHNRIRDPKLFSSLIRNTDDNPQGNWSDVLMWAVSWDNSTAINLLLKETEADPTLYDNFMIRNAAEAGSYHVVAALLTNHRFKTTDSLIEIIGSVTHRGYWPISVLLLLHLDPTINNNRLVKLAVKNLQLGLLRLLLRHPKIRSETLMKELQVIAETYHPKRWDLMAMLSLQVHKPLPNIAFMKLFELAFYSQHKELVAMINKNNDTIGDWNEFFPAIVSNSSPSVIQLLLAQTDINPKSPLVIKAAKDRNDPKIMNLLSCDLDSDNFSKRLARYGFQPPNDKELSTPLESSAKRGAFEEVEQLLQIDNPNLKKDLQIAMEGATDAGHPHIALLILQKINLQKNRRPLIELAEHAIQQNAVELLSILVSYKDLSNDDLEWLQGFAASFGNRPEIDQILLKALRTKLTESLPSYKFLKLLDQIVNGKASVSVSDPLIYKYPWDKFLHLLALKAEPEDIETLVKLDLVNPTAHNHFVIKQQLNIENLDIVEILLISETVDLTFDNNFLIRAAASRGHAELFEYLLGDPRIYDNQNLLHILQSMTKDRAILDLIAEVADEEPAQVDPQVTNLSLSITAHYKALLESHEDTLWRKDFEELLRMEEHFNSELCTIFDTARKNNSQKLHDLIRGPSQFLLKLKNNMLKKIAASTRRQIMRKFITEKLLSDLVALNIANSLRVLTTYQIIDSNSNIFQACLVTAKRAKTPTIYKLLKNYQYSQKNNPKEKEKQKTSPRNSIQNSKSTRSKEKNRKRKRDNEPNELKRPKQIKVQDIKEETLRSVALDNIADKLIYWLHKAKRPTHMLWDQHIVELVKRGNVATIKILVGLNQIDPSTPSFNQALKLAEKKPGIHKLLESYQRKHNVASPNKVSTRKRKAPAPLPSPIPKRVKETEDFDMASEDFDTAPVIFTQHMWLANDP